MSITRKRISGERKYSLHVLWWKTSSGKCVCSYSWGGSRGGSGGSVEPPKLNVQTYNKRLVKKKVNHLSYGGDFRAIKPLQIAPENAGNRISEAIKLNIFRGSMPPDPPRGYRLLRAFIRTPLRQILDPPQLIGIVQALRIKKNYHSFKLSS